MAGGGSSTQHGKTSFVTDILEPTLTTGETRATLGKVGDIATGAAESPYFQELQNIIFNPQPLKLDALNQALAQSAISEYGGNRALRNIGPPTNEEIIQQSLPYFQKQRQQNIANLLTGQQTQLSTTDLIIQALLDIASVGQPTPVAGQEGTTSGSSGSFSLFQ